MGKVCSKAHGLRYADDDYFIGTRLGPEGKCLSSQESICQSTCNSLKLKAEEGFGTGSGYQLKCSEAFTERVKDGLFASCKAAEIEDCNLIVNLPPEGKRDEKDFASEVEIPMKIDAQDSVRCQKDEELKNSHFQSKSNQNEWSYTVYDIDGGSKVTQEDLSHVMNSIRTAIDETVDNSAQGSSKDMKMLKIKVAIGHHDNNENEKKIEKKPHLGFNRMILPPPDSEEAELLCYYIREKLLTFTNQEKNANREASHERKRSKSRVREGNAFSTRSPDISAEPQITEPSRGSRCRKSFSSKNDTETSTNDGHKETSFSSPTPTVCCQGKRNVTASDDLRQPQANRPLYGLPQRQDTYGGAVDLQAERLRHRCRQRSPPSSGTRSPHICVNEMDQRDWTSEHSYDMTDHDRKATSKHSSFCHKDAYRESKEGDSPRKAKRSIRKGQFDQLKGRMPSCSKNDQFPASPWSVPRERRSNPSKICPCKYRGGRHSRDKKRNPRTSMESDQHMDTISSQACPRHVATAHRNESPSHDDVFSRDEAISSGGANSRDEKVPCHSEQNTCQRSGEDSRSMGEIRTAERLVSSTDLRTDETNTTNCKSPVYSRRFNNLTWREERTPPDDLVMQNEVHQAEDTRSLEDNAKSPKSTPAANNSSNESSTEASHSSSWKDQMPFGPHSTCRKFVHEWDPEVELSTGNMIGLMQEQDTRFQSGTVSPQTQAINIVPSKDEQVHRHEHYHYHYHIFKRS